MRSEQALPLIEGRLAELVAEPVESLSPSGETLRWRSRGLTFVVAFASQATVPAVGAAVQGVTQERGSEVVPLVAVPYMAEVGRAFCRSAGVSWLDLSGNASIEAPNLRILVLGEPNRYKRRGRPANLFAPKAARIARQLLLDPARHHRQADLVRLTRLGSGYVSTVVGGLLEAGLVDYDDERRRYPPVPDQLLETWAGAYRLDGHQRLAGHVAARSGMELFGQVVASLAEEELSFAATGLPAAWLLAPMAMYRLVAVYLRRLPPTSLLSELGFREEPRGANLWFLVSEDDGVFHGAVAIDGVPVVSPVQVWLDLQAMAERSAEAAAELRRRRLNWSVGDGG